MSSVLQLHSSLTVSAPFVSQGACGRRVQTSRRYTTFRENLRLRYTSDNRRLCRKTDTSATRAGRQRACGDCCARARPGTRHICRTRSTCGSWRAFQFGQGGVRCTATAPGEMSFMVLFAWTLCYFL